MHISRKQILTSTAVALAIAWVPGALRLRALRREMAEVSQTLAETQREVTDAEGRLAQRRRQVATSAEQRDQLLASAALTEKALAQSDPESRWASPPGGEQRWNPESPYVWLNKEALKNLPLSPLIFDGDGELGDRIAGILGVDDATYSRLNQKLSAIVKDYRTASVGNVKTLTELPPDIANVDGEKLAIEVVPQPKENGRYQEAFTAAIRENLGPERSELILSIAGQWLTSEFNLSDGNPTTIGVVRHADGSYKISTRTGGSFLQLDGARTLVDYIPAHLLPFFQKLDNGVTSKSGGP
jgi:hypothetical protein